MKLIICQECNKEVKSRGNNQIYCRECSEKRDVERKRLWYERNKPKPKREDRTGKKCFECGRELKLIKFRDGNLYCEKHYNEMYRHGRIKKLNGKRKVNKVNMLEHHAEFETTNKQIVLIDFVDLHLLNEGYWGVNSQGYIHSRINGELVRIHRRIMKPGKNEEIDHINRNPLDNRRDNLRVCTSKENGRNLSIKINNQSGVPGVSKDNKSGKWRSRLMLEGKEINLGYYDDFNEAVKARSKAEHKYFGEYAPEHKLN